MQTKIEITKDGDINIQPNIAEVVATLLAHVGYKPAVKYPGTDRFTPFYGEGCPANILIILKKARKKRKTQVQIVAELLAETNKPLLDILISDGNLPTGDQKRK